jgi:hypothetical protein
MREATIVSLFFVILGLILTIFSRNFAEQAVKAQNRFWKFHFGEKEVAITQKIAFIVGLAFLAFGVSSLLGFIKIKSYEGVYTQDFLGLALTALGWSLLYFRQNVTSFFLKLFKFKSLEDFLNLLVMITGIGIIAFGTAIFFQLEVFNIFTLYAVITIIFGWSLIFFRQRSIFFLAERFKLSYIFQNLLHFLFIVSGCGIILIGFYFLMKVIM